MGVEERGVLGTNDQIAVGNEVQSAAHGHSVDRGNDGLPAAVLDGREMKPRALVRVGIALPGVARCDVGHVHSRAQGFLPRSGQDDADDFGIGLDVLPEATQFPGHLQRERVMAFWTVQGDRRDAFALLAEQGLEFHGVAPPTGGLG